MNDIHIGLPPKHCITTSLLRRGFSPNNGRPSFTYEQWMTARQSCLDQLRFINQLVEFNVITPVSEDWIVPAGGFECKNEDQPEKEEASLPLQTLSHDYQAACGVGVRKTNGSIVEVKSIKDGVNWISSRYPTFAPTGGDFEYWDESTIAKDYLNRLIALYGYFTVYFGARAKMFPEKTIKHMGQISTLTGYGKVFSFPSDAYEDDTPLNVLPE